VQGRHIHDSRSHQGATRTCPQQNGLVRAPLTVPGRTSRDVSSRPSSRHKSIEGCVSYRWRPAGSYDRRSCHVQLSRTNASVHPTRRSRPHSPPDITGLADSRARKSRRDASGTNAAARLRAAIGPANPSNIAAKPPRTYASHARASLQKPATKRTSHWALS
jgi:hypothetical protein